ncbi:uncharacterized protein GJ701_003666 isoform 1-T1 [Geothlypis trichas]
MTDENLNRKLKISLACILSLEAESYTEISSHLSWGLKYLGSGVFCIAVIGSLQVVGMNSIDRSRMRRWIVLVWPLAEEERGFPSDGTYKQLHSHHRQRKISA